MKKLVLLLFIIFCLIISGYGGQEKKDVVSECQVNCDGFETETLTMKAYSDAVDVIWRYKFTMRLWQDGRIQFISTDYNYNNTFDYIKDFAWDGVAIPLDGETFNYLMNNGNVITVSRIKDYIAVNYAGVYNLIVRCAISTNSSGDKFELANSKFIHENILQVYPFDDCGP